MLRTLVSVFRSKVSPAGMVVVESGTQKNAALSPSVMLKQETMVGGTEVNANFTP